MLLGTWKTFTQISNSWRPGNKTKYIKKKIYFTKNSLSTKSTNRRKNGMVGQNWKYAITNYVYIHRNNYINWRYKHQCKQAITTLKNGTKKLLKNSNLFNTLIYHQEKELILSTNNINITNKILNYKVLPCPSISNHDALYIIAKNPKK